MSRGVNKVILLGNLGKAPEIKEAKTGNRYCNFSVATSSAWTDKKTGEKTEDTQWHRIIAFGRLADIAGDFLDKGSKVFIEGSLQTRKWKDDNNIEHYLTEVIARNIEILTKKIDASVSRDESENHYLSNDLPF